MPLFMVKKRYFEMYESGVKDVELRVIKPPWKNSKVGDVATILCGRRSRMSTEERLGQSFMKWEVTNGYFRMPRTC